MTDIQKERILIADDDPAILHLIRTIVEKEGYVPVVARDGKEAYHFLKNDAPFATVILDIVMPFIEGTELIKAMMQEKKLMNIPIIIMTAEQNPRLPAEGMRSGAIVFLHKPFTASQLKAMLNMCVNRNTKQKI